LSFYSSPGCAGALKLTANRVTLVERYISHELDKELQEIVPLGYRLLLSW
jgi:hypothetical protein